MSDEVRVEWFERDALAAEVARRVERSSVVLDVGPGIRPQQFFKPDVHILAEPYGDYVEVLRGHYTGSSTRVVLLQGTALEVLRLLPAGSVDSVFMVDVIEHLPKAEGAVVLAESVRVARRQVVVFTPLGFVEQDYHPGEEDGWGLSGGEWQKHRSGWEPEDFDPTWAILACRAFHETTGSGEPLIPPAGAFWAIRTVPPPSPPPLKFLLVSQTLPPAPTDQAVLLERLLAGLPAGSYAVASSEVHRDGEPAASNPPRLAGRYHELPPAGDHAGGRLAAARRLTRGAQIVLSRAEAIRRIVVSEGLEAIVGCSGDLYDMPAAWLAARLARVPFFAYYLGLHAQPRRPGQGVVRALDALVSHGCAGVLASNEHLASALATRHGAPASLVRSPACGVTQERRPWPARPGSLVIVHTGAIDAAGVDSLRLLVAAITDLGRPGVELWLYTSTSQDDLARGGLLAPFVRVRRELSLHRVRAVHAAADLFFLPLSFDPQQADVTRTTAPGRLGDYLASGRPVLAHAPADTFVAWYLSHHECGAVVDVREPAALVRALARLSDDGAWRERLVESALARARQDFSPARSREALFDALARGRAARRPPPP